MKLGVSYNLFDGEELLESSIKSIRSNVDYISVVYQTQSNFGNPCSEELLPLLTRLESEGLIDELFEYRPNVSKGGHYNEIRKRNLGLTLSETAGCTHHMTMDSDELYTDEQLKYVKKIIEDGDYDSSACQMKTYFKDPSYEIRPMNSYYVSLIFKIRQGVEFVFGQQFPVLVDPTRRMDAGVCKVFTREEVEMYHMSYVRKNIESKLTNSSSRGAFTDVKGFLEMFKSYKVGDTFFTTHPPGNETTILVENKFNISI